VNVQWDELYVRILDPKNGLLLREHVRQKRGWYRIKKEDRPQYMPLHVSRSGRSKENSVNSDPVGMLTTFKHCAYGFVSCRGKDENLTYWSQEARCRESTTILTSQMQDKFKCVHGPHQASACECAIGAWQPVRLRQKAPQYSHLRQG
jgi:hypothetical protein